MARRAGDYGVRTGPISVDMTVVRQRKRDIVEMFHEGSESAVTSAEGVDLLMGEARFIGERTVQVTLNDGSHTILTAERIFIDTGTRNITPPIDGIDNVCHYDSTSIMELDEVPEHLVVVAVERDPTAWGVAERRAFMTKAAHCGAFCGCLLGIVRIDLDHPAETEGLVWFRGDVEARMIALPGAIGCLLRQSIAFVGRGARILAVEA